MKLRVPEACKLYSFNEFLGGVTAMQYNGFFRQGQTSIQQNANSNCNSAQTYLTLSHALPADKLITLSGFKCRCSSSLFTIFVATVTFLLVSTSCIYFSLWGESLS